MNTKTIAHRANVTTAVVNATARDLDLAMTYDFDTHCYRITNHRDAIALTAHLANI